MFVYSPEALFPCCFKTVEKKKTQWRSCVTAEVFSFMILYALCTYACSKRMPGSGRCAVHDSSTEAPCVTLCVHRSNLHTRVLQVCIKNINAHINFVLTFLGRLHPCSPNRERACFNSPPPKTHMASQWWLMKKAVKQWSFHNILKQQDQ